MKSTKLNENKALVSKLLRAMESGNTEVLNNLLSDDFVWWIPGNLEYFSLAGEKDKAFFIGFIAQNPKNFPKGLTMTEKSMTAEGDQVAAQVVGYGETAYGKTYNNYYHFLIEMHEGKIIRMSEYMDTYHAKDVFGL